MHSPKEHWENVYQTKQADAVSWFQERATRSLEIIHSVGATTDASIIADYWVPTRVSNVSSRVNLKRDTTAIWSAWRRMAVLNAPNGPALLAMA